MSDNQKLSEIRYSKYNRRFHALSLSARRKCLELVQGGETMEKALRMARRTK